MSTLLAPLQLSTFRRLILAYSVNALGTWLGEIALAVLVLRETGSPAWVAGVFVVGQLLPSLTVPAVVARVERVPTARGLAGLLAVEAMLFAVLAAAADDLSMALILALVGLDGAARLAVRALNRAAIVAATAPVGLQREANSILAAVFTTCAAAGPFLGGLVIAHSSTEFALAADAVSFGLAALIIVGHRGFAQADTDEPGLRSRLRAGLAHVSERPDLRRLLSVFSAICLFGAAIMPIEIVLVTDTLGGSETAYGTVLALWGAGAIVGSALLALLRHLSTRLLIAGSFAVLATSYVGMGTAQSVEVVCVFSLVGGVANGIEAFATMTAIQETTADQYQARIGGFVEALAGACTGLGFLVGGLIATLVSVRAVYLIAGLGFLALAATLALAQGTSARTGNRVGAGAVS